MNRIATTALWTFLLGCGSSTMASTDAATDTSAQDAGSNYTLQNCSTNIAADVPAFYRTYFRCVTIASTADGVTITANGLPPHASYYYGAGHPNYAEFDRTRGTQYNPNPNVIRAQTVQMTVPNTPVSRGLSITTNMVDRMANTNANEYSGGAVGIALDSVFIFNDQAAPRDDIDDERFTFDGYEAHPTQTGTYHYHAASPGPLEVLQANGMTSNTTPGNATVELYGMMCDGTVVLGCTELDGTAALADGLDAQNGHVGDLRGTDGTVHFSARYHTHVCPGRFTTHKYTPEIQYYRSCNGR